MLISKKKSVRVFLDLSEDEARWLMGVMQNPFWHSADSNNAMEPPEQRDFRKEFFDSLKQQLD